MSNAFDHRNLSEPNSFQMFGPTGQAIMMARTLDNDTQVTALDRYVTDDDESVFTGMFTV